MFAKRTTYACIPVWQKEVKRDPFDYNLRSKEDVIQEFKYFAPNIQLKANYKRYLAGDVRQNTENNLDNRDRVAKVFFDIRNFNLAPLQRQRFIFLMGPRYDLQRPHYGKIVISQYNTFHENYIRAMETLREIYWESKRAPSINTTMLKNPYRREFLMKKMLGKTKDERQRKLIEFTKLRNNHQKTIDKAEVEQDLQLTKKNDIVSEKRRQHGQQRAQLGFKDQQPEVDDPVLEQLEFNRANYEKSLKEQRERKKINIVADVKGISKDEYLNSMLRPDEQFK